MFTRPPAQRLKVMNKCALAWLCDLPTPIRDKAIINTLKQSNSKMLEKHYSDAANAVCGSFTWDDTKEGGKYWGAVFDHLDKPTRNAMPPLP